MLLLGLAYKRNTGDTRESPGMVIAQSPVGARRRGPGGRPARAAREPPPCPLVELTADEVQQADAVVVVTDHDAFDYDLVREHARYVLDTRNRIQRAARSSRCDASRHQR